MVILVRVINLKMYVLDRVTTPHYCHRLLEGLENIGIIWWRISSIHNVVNVYCANYIIEAGISFDYSKLRVRSLDNEGTLVANIINHFSKIVDDLKKENSSLKSKVEDCQNVINDLIK